MFKNGVPGIPLSKDWSTHKKLAFFKMMVDAGVLPWQTFSGNPLQFNAPKAHTLKSVKVEFEPKQDLHGYDAPWPAGGGKNIVHFEDVPTTTKNAVTYRIENNILYINGTATAGFSISAEAISLGSATYTLSAQTLSGTLGGVNNSLNAYSSAQTRYIAAFGNTGSGVRTFTDDIARIDMSINNTATFNNAVIGLQLEINASKTFFAPYSNISPISGWTGVDIYDEPDYDPTATPKLTVTWQDEAGTVYGGYLRINRDGSVDLIAPTMLWTAPNTGWSVYGEDIYYHNIPDETINVEAGARWYSMSSTFKRLQSLGNWYQVINAGEYTYNVSGISGQKRVWIRYDGAGTFSDVVNGATFVFLLQNPVTYHLPSVEALQALQGINTIWSDANGDVTVEARAEAVNNA